jgi:hypothetical protein
MNSPKLVIFLGLVLIVSVFLTACGGGGSTPPPPPSPPTIRTSELPSGAVNTPYGGGGQGIVLSAAGGTTPYTWSISSGTLPPGMTLNSSTGLLSGTPTTLGNYTFTAKVTDAAGLSGTQNLSIYVEGVVIVSPMCGTSPAPNLCPSGSAGVFYSQTLTVSGGLPPYTWAVAAGSNPLPSGLSLDPATCTNSSGSCVISGTPTTNGAPTTFTMQVTDSETSPGVPAVGSSNFTITIMSVTTGSLPSGYLNVAYSGSLTVAGGSTPYTWTATGLPPGLSLDPACLGTKLQTCAIKGTPTQTGTFTATVKVLDGEKGNPAVATAVLGITVFQSQLTIGGTLPAGQEGVPYNSSLAASGGVAPYTWSISSGNLPPGLSLDPATCTKSSVPCVVSGTPSTPGPYNFTVQVTDSGSPQQPASAPFSILISFNPLVITTASLPAGLVGVPYSATLMATGGLKPYTWCIIEASGSCDNGAGILPAGLTLDPGRGVISGTPTSQGTSSFNVQAQDSGTPQQTVRSTSPLSIAITSLDNSTLNGNYVFTFSGYSDGMPVMMAGSFVADGTGTLTSGVLDYNDGSGEPGGNNPTPQTFVAGSVYSINPDGSGSMTIMTDKPMTFKFAIAIRTDGSGNLIQSDPANPKAYGSGAIMGNTPLKQGEIFPLCGQHVALGFFGFDDTLVTRYAGAGQFQFDPNTCLDAENGTMDTDDGGSLSQPTFTGAFNGLVPNTSRGIAGLTLSPGGRHFYAFYLVSSSDRKTNKLFWVSTEPVSQPAALTLWSGFQQGSSALCGSPNNWNNSCLSGTAVAELNALDTNGAVDVTSGLFVGNGALANNCQNNTFDVATLTFDENRGGTCNGGTCGGQPQYSQGTYCVDKNTGRVTLTGFSGAFGGALPVFYLVRSDQAFVVGTDPAVTFGSFEPQTGSPFTNSSLFGLYAGGTIAPITTNVTNGVGTLFADGGGNINGTQNTSGPAGPNQQPFTYTYAVDNTGRALVCASGTCTAQSNNIIGVAYVVSPTKFVLLPATDPNPALSVFGQ